MKSKRCPAYCGITCVNGQCPNALDEMVEEVMAGTERMSDEETRKRVNSDIHERSDIS